jgi:hypothetical protein
MLVGPKGSMHEEKNLLLPMPVRETDSTSMLAMIADIEILLTSAIRHRSDVVRSYLKLHG